MSIQEESYISVAREASWECPIKRSRFIGICAPIVSEDDANRFLERMKDEYPAARHYVYAWKTNSPYLIQKYSDDGEPQGTGGRPVLDVLENAGIDRGIICVVRYFGGILLGTGGLARAYSQSAAGALDKAGVKKYLRYHIFSLEVEYSVYDKLNARLETSGFYQDNAQFSSKVKLDVGASSDRIKELQLLVQDITAGSGELIPQGERFLPHP
ncbi:MAG: YigZ family protein [Eubacteriales bacterium]|nr:YigZ family protein [Eubacteriales bacterium]MDD4323438.1 YigZ family protein [Eubacteriales bacterium]MDD4541134.1 YigZ family protein [Eubacteriales bacterium]